MEYLFALMRNDVVKKISISKDIIESIKLVFIKGEKEFRPKDVEENEFTGDFISRDKEDIIFVKFNLPESFENLKNNYADIPDFQIGEDLPKSIFWKDNERYLFQIFNKGNLLNKKFILKMCGDKSFSRMQDNAFMLNDKIQALYENGKLYFQSYNVANKIFSLSDFAVEATEAEIEDFGKLETLSIDIQRVKNISNVKTRRLISLVLKTNNIPRLVAMSKNKRAKLLKDFGINTSVDQYGKLQIPTETVGELNRTLEFLNEDIYSGAISGEHFRTNSKKKDK